MEDLIQLILFLVFLACGFFVGGTVEKKHYASIREREKSLINMIAVNNKNFVSDLPVRDTQFVYGSVAISTDYFKMVFAGLKNFLGGNMSAYESLVDRARREAVLRLKEMAEGSDMVVNLRIETSPVQEGCVEAFAYGTAIYLQKS